MRKAFLALTVLAVVVGTAPALAQAEPDIVIIDIDRIVRGQQGQVFEVARVSVEADLFGATCTGTARTENNSSEHPNTDLIIASGGDSSVIEDFERSAGMVTMTDETLVLGEMVTVSVRLGAHGVSSASVMITLTCTPLPPPTTTTTTEAPTTTTTTQPAPTTTQPVTTTPAPTTTQPAAEATTTEPPPVGGVSAGGGAMADPADDGAAVAWTIAGALLLLAALAVVAVRRMARDEGRPYGHSQ